MTDALSVLAACQVRRNWPDGPATSMRVPPSVVDFLDVTVPLLARASVNGVSTVNAKDDDVERGQLSAKRCFGAIAEKRDNQIERQQLPFSRCASYAGHEAATLRIEVEIFVGRLFFWRRVALWRLVADSRSVW